MNEMLLRGAGVTVTDLDIILHLHQSARNTKQLREFLQAYNRRNVSTYMMRLKFKGYVTKSGNMFTLTPKAIDLIERLRQTL